MSTHVVNEFYAKPGRGDDVLALLLELSPESRSGPGCEAISLRRNQDDPN
jgi:quinol monooxygenase YgiN